MRSPVVTADSAAPNIANSAGLAAPLCAIRRLVLPLARLAVELSLAVALPLTSAGHRLSLWWRWALVLAVFACLVLAVNGQWLLLIVIAPLLEETVFRAGLHEALIRALGPQAGRLLLANLLTALVFAMAHVLIRGDVGAALTFFPALLIGAAYQGPRRLLPCIAMHGFFNAVWLTVT